MEYTEKVNNWLKQNNDFTKSNSDTTHPLAGNERTSYAERVNEWLASNKHLDNSTLILPVYDGTETDINTTTQIICPSSKPTGNDIDSLHSVDTAKYILSNNKKTKTRITRMTIKEYCHLSSSNNRNLNRSRSVDCGFVRRISSTDNVPKVKIIRRNIQSASSTDSSERCGVDFKCTPKHQKRYRRICHRKQSFDQRSKFLSIVSELRKRSNSDDDDDEPADGLNVVVTDASSCTKRLRRCNFIGKNNLKS